MNPIYRSQYGEAFEGDCLDVMRTMPGNSIDTIITDPPYGIGFMGRNWDKGLPRPEYWEEMLRIIKPGGYMTVNGHPKTFHRLYCIIEDAGWIIQDTLCWLFGDAPGFGMNISKAIDKFLKKLRGIPIDDPPVPEAKPFDGYHSQLKPGWEPIGLFMKPLDGTYVNNALTHGLAGLNIDGCRLRHYGDNLIRGDTFTPWKSGYERPWMHNEEKIKRFKQNKKIQEQKSQNIGRYPPNVALDETAAGMLNEQSGELKSNAKDRINKNSISRGSYGIFKPCITAGYDDIGGASRFFYCPKAGPGEKNRGLNEYCSHPTVKPIELIRWLCRLTKTPRVGKILDPFAGTFTTGIAAALEQRYFILIENDPESVKIGMQRLRSCLGMFMHT